MTKLFTRYISAAELREEPEVWRALSYAGSNAHEILRGYDPELVFLPQPRRIVIYDVYNGPRLWALQLLHHVREVYLYDDYYDKTPVWGATFNADKLLCITPFTEPLSKQDADELRPMLELYKMNFAVQRRTQNV